MPQAEFIDSLPETTRALSMVKYGAHDFITFDVASGAPYVVCTNCLVLLQVGSYDQHLVGTKKDTCYKRFPKGVDLFSEIQGGKGTKKQDSDKFWRQFFIDYAGVVGVNKKLFSKSDVTEKTDEFKAYATETLAEIRKKSENRHFFYLERDGVKALLFSPYLASGKVRGVCVCKNEDGELCGFVSCLNKVAGHLTKNHTKVKTNRVLRNAVCINIKLPGSDVNKGDMEEVGTMEGEDVFFPFTALHISLPH